MAAEAEFAGLVLDGELLEGGGQVLRNAVALAALLGKDVRVINVRGGRAKPGLRAQHSAGLRLVADLTASRLEGAEVGSGTVTLRPGPDSLEGARGGDEVVADPRTAGSTMLLLQVSLPVAVFLPAPPRLVLRGGTDAGMSPIFGYSSEVLLPTLRRLVGVRAELELRRRGWFPRGGGEVAATVQPCPGPLPAFSVVSRGELKSVRARVLLSGSLPAHVGERAAASLLRTLRARVPATGALDVRVDCAPEPGGADGVASSGNGVSVLLVAETTEGLLFGASALGERRLKAERLGAGVAEDFAADWEAGACVDRHMQDQLIVWAALAAGTSQIRCGPLSLHTRTAMHWARVVTGADVTSEANDDGSVTITCRGVGYVSRFGAA